MVITFSKVSKNTNKWLLLCKLCGKIIVGGKVVESKATVGFQNLILTENLFKTYLIEITLHNYLASWKQQHKKYKKYRKEEFYYDGFMYNLQNSSHSVLYIFDYKYDDRQTKRRIYNMQNFISRHCLDSEITNSSISYLILNKTNSKCIDTISYVKDFEINILQEISIIKPTMIICCGCYEVVSNIFEKYGNSDVLSAIKNIPRLEMLPPAFKIKDKWFQLHFEDKYFRMFGWNI